MQFLYEFGAADLTVSIILFEVYFSMRMFLLNFMLVGCWPPVYG